MVLDCEIGFYSETPMHNLVLISRVFQEQLRIDTTGKAALDDGRCADFVVHGFGRQPIGYFARSQIELTLHPLSKPRCQSMS